MSISSEKTVCDIPRENRKHLYVVSRPPEKEQRISVRHFSELADINRDTLVYYIKEGLITPAVTEKNGYQYFYPDQLRTITFIKYMRRFGIPLSEIKSMLAGIDAEGIYQTLNRHNLEIHNHIQKIERSLHFLEQLHQLIDFLEAHPEDIPFFCELEGARLYQTPVRFCHSLNDPSNAKIVSDFLDFNDGELPDHLICCRIPEEMIMKDHFCHAMQEYSQRENQTGIIDRPAGTYACVIHRGGSFKVGEKVELIKKYISTQGMEPAGDVFVLNSTGYDNLTPSGHVRFLVEMPVKPSGNSF